MRVLGLMMVRNGEGGLPEALDAMAEYCDGACVVVDRSTDGTEDIVRRHPLVRACDVIPPGGWSPGSPLCASRSGRHGTTWSTPISCR